MTKTVLTAIAVTLLSVAAMAPQTASAQNAILAEMYGRGVHAYYSGDSTKATRLLTMAIDNGTKDPRAFYFRGLVAHASGNQHQAEADWQKGAELEATGQANPAIGRSLVRFQGSARLKLESIRQEARLKAMATSMARSKARYGEIEAAEARVLRKPPQPPTPRATGVTPPPSAPGAKENPFADDMASGQPSLESDDALKDAMKNPFEGQAIPAGEVPPNDDANPFGDDAGGGADPNPFGDDMGDDPNPFGDDSGDAPNPFGDSGGDDSNPFGDDSPF